MGGRLQQHRGSNRKKWLKGRNVILSGVCNSAGALADVAPAPNGEAMRGAPAGVSPAPNGEAMREVRFFWGGGLPERTESGTGRCVRSGCVLVGEAVRDGSLWAGAGPRGGGLGNRRWPFVKKKSKKISDESDIYFAYRFLIPEGIKINR